MPNIAVRADSLLLKQMCRMLNLPGEESFHLLGYWLGGFLRDTGFDENFPELADLGPVSHTMTRSFPLHQYMLDTFLEAVGRGEVRRNNIPVATTVLLDEVLRVGQQAAQLAGRGDAWDLQQNAAQGDDFTQNRQDNKSILKNVTTKAIYTSRMTDMLVPPKVELKFPQVNFKKLVYPRVVPAVLEMKVRDVIFSIVHGIYKNRERLFQQGRVEDQLCPNQACKNETLTQTIEHTFCSCYKVRAAWQWTKQKLTELWADEGPAVGATNMQIIMQMYPSCRKEIECSFLLGTFLELVHREVMVKGKELLVNTLKGVLQAKLTQNRSRAVPDVLFPQNWL